MAKQLESLLTFIPHEAEFIRSEEEEENLYEGTNYEITEIETEEIIASCVFNESGELLNYHYIGDYEKGNLKSKDAIAKSEYFIETFYPQGLDTYVLDGVFDLDGCYMINYGVKDEKYGLIIPHLGFTVTVSTSGQMIQFIYVNEPYKIDYPDHIISTEEAKEHYLSKLKFELVVRHLDPEVYVNGDDSYHLVYRILESATDIPATGEEPMTVEQSVELKTIKHQDTPFQTVYDMVGLTEEHIQIGEQIHRDERIELWAHYSTQVPADIDYLDEYCEQMIRIVFHNEDYRLLFVHNGEVWAGKKDDGLLSDDILEKAALDFIFLLYQDSHKQFRLEETEMHDGYEDEEVYDEYENEEESIAFYFHTIIDDIQVEEKVSCIQVGKYTGKITGVVIEHVTERSISDIQTKPMITKKEAEQIYANDLEMKLIFTVEYDEDGEEQIQLSYIPSFPKTNGHIQAIDAQTGKGYHVDVGDSLFY